MPLKSNTAVKQNGHWLDAVLAPLIDSIDRYLRSRHQVAEYSTCPDCLFRLQIIENDDEFVLKDGTSLRPGDRLVDLHFWNEQVPEMPEGGPTLAFARRMERCLDISLSELARYLSTRSDLSDVKAIRGNMSLGASDRSDQIARIAARYGFTRFVRHRRPSLGETLHWVGENILITLLVLRRNPSAIRPDTLWRDRTLTFLSRRALEQKYSR